jgi:hypothetical protein
VRGGGRQSAAHSTAVVPMEAGGAAVPMEAGGAAVPMEAGGAAVPMEAGGVSRLRDKNGPRAKEAAV